MNFFNFLLFLAFLNEINSFAKKLNIPYKKDFSSFQKFTNNYEKLYKSSEQMDKGYNNFKKNIDLINDHNQNTTNSFSLRLNHFADEDPSKLKKKLFSFEIERQEPSLILNSKNNDDIKSFTNPYNKLFLKYLFFF